MTRERRPCACHGFIETISDPVEIEHAVRTHQRTLQHQQYVDRLLADAYAPSFEVRLSSRATLTKIA